MEYKKCAKRLQISLSEWKNGGNSGLREKKTLSNTVSVHRRKVIVFGKKESSLENSFHFCLYEVPNVLQIFSLFCIVRPVSKRIASRVPQSLKRIRSFEAKLPFCLTIVCASRDLSAKKYPNLISPHNWSMRDYKCKNCANKQHNSNCLWSSGCYSHGIFSNVNIYIYFDIDPNNK